MSIQRVNPAELAPATGFSHAVTVSNSTLVALAGQTALDSEGRITGTTITEQFERALDNLLTALRACGGEPSDLVSLTVYLVDVADYREHAAQIGKLWSRAAGREYPAMAVIGISRLWDQEALIELQGWAAIESHRATR